MTSRLSLQAHTAGERHDGTRRVADAIQAVGGFVVDVRQYSNVALMLRFELSGADLPRLVRELEAAGIRLDDASHAAVDAEAVRAGTVDATLHLRFYHDEPDLRIPTPDVPG